MRRILIAILLMSSAYNNNSFSSNAVIPDSLNKEIITERDSIGMLVGLCNRAGLLKMPYDSWFKPVYNDYSVDMKTLKKAKGLLENIRITVFMGTWCGDSREQVPQFYKILDSLHFDESGLTLICLDRDKKSPSDEQKGMNIERVPTMVFYRGTDEIGRIIETPEKILEKDIVRILSGK